VSEHPSHAEPRRLGVALALYGLFTFAVLLPLALVVLWSFADRWSAPDLLPQATTLRHWAGVLGDGAIVEAALASLLIAVLVTLLTGAVAIPPAWAIAKLPLRGKRWIEVFVLSPLIVPGVVVAVGIGEVFLRLGLMYSVAGVVLVQMVGTLPLMIRILVASFEALPDELIHAARSLGATPLAAFAHVVLPLTVPGLLAGGLLSFVASFEEFDKSFVVGAPVIETLPILLYQSLDPYTLQFPMAATVALVLLVPVIVVFVISGRVMREDLTAAGMGKL
jgi:multiple sugar transport system permease protein/putative spermidine/putrescine transport system permease protein